MRILILLFSLIVLSGCEDTNVYLATDAAKDAVTAVTLSDEQVVALARQAALSADSRHRIAEAGSAYDNRLQQLTGRYRERDGHRFTFNVYLTDEVNAFAMADGTIRVYSGLMDLMDDDELLFIIGHEMGHVVHDHSRKKVVLAYGASAIRKGLASQQNELGALAASVVGGFAEQLTNAQFSQHEEKEADRYGVQFLLEEDMNRDAAQSALRKLASHSASYSFLSSHPDPQKRADELAPYRAEEEVKKESLFKKLYDFIVLIFLAVWRLFLMILNWIVSIITAFL